MKSKKFVNIKNSIQVFFMISVVSGLFALFDIDKYYIAFFNSMFLISGILLIVSGFRYISQRNGYNTVKYSIYILKKALGFTNASKRAQYVEKEEKDKLFNKENNKQKKETKNKKPIDFVVEKEDISQLNTAMFYGSILTFVFSILMTLSR